VFSGSCWVDGDFADDFVDDFECSIDSVVVAVKECYFWKWLSREE
jgi:hypothetical protein